MVMKEEEDHQLFMQWAVWKSNNPQQIYVVVLDGRTLIHGMLSFIMLVRESRATDDHLRMLAQCTSATNPYELLMLIWIKLMLVVHKHL